MSNSRVDRPPDVIAVTGASGDRGVQQSALDGARQKDSTDRGGRRRFLVFALAFQFLGHDRVVHGLVREVRLDIEAGA